MRNWKMIRTFTLLLFLVLSPSIHAGAALHAGSLPPDRDSVRRALRQGDWEEAASAAARLLDDGGDEDGELYYLHALAWVQGEEWGKARDTVRKLQQEFPRSRWFLKARFLEARVHVAMGAHEEAEKIYDEEARRLLSEERKETLAGILVRFADDLAQVPEPSELAAPPANFPKAIQLYERALGMEIGLELRGSLLMKLGHTHRLQKDMAAAARYYQQYLEEYDPAWSAFADEEMDKELGEHASVARYELARTFIDRGQVVEARRILEDLVTLLLEAEARSTARWCRGVSRGAMIADARWQIVRSWGLPQVPGSEGGGPMLDTALHAASEFLTEHTSHPHAIVVAWSVAEALAQHGRTDESIASFRDFAEGRSYTLPTDDVRGVPLPGVDASPEELAQEWSSLALFRIGELRASQQDYASAISVWDQYVRQAPDGSRWSNAQRNIIEARYEIAMEQVRKREYPGAEASIHDFLQRYPLDDRAIQALFTLGQIDKTRGDEVHKESPGSEESRSHYLSAVATWERLVSKYPRTDPASLALYRSGLIQETRLHELDKAIQTYRKVTFGSWQPHAQMQLLRLTEKSLQVSTERVFRTDEAPVVRVESRNIEQLSVRMYALDPEAFFRKKHELGSIESLDIGLIQPDHSFDVDVKEYQRYAPHEQDLEIPFDGAAPGVYIVNISGGNLEATTMVLRSDLDMVVRANRTDVIVFAQDMRSGKPAVGVELLLSDGLSVIATERTGTDGVYKSSLENLEHGDVLGILAQQDGHVAVAGVNLEGLWKRSGLTPRTYLYMDRPAYQPGQVVSFRGIIRDIEDGVYVVPAASAYRAMLIDTQSRVVADRTVEASDFGSFEGQFVLDQAAPAGTYRLEVRRVEKDREDEVLANRPFLVQAFTIPNARMTFTFDHEAYFRGETVMGHIFAEYRWGQPVAGSRLQLIMPDGRQLEEKTDEEGMLRFSFNTAQMTPGKDMIFVARLVDESVITSGVVLLPDRAFKATVSMAQEVITAGEPVEVTVRTLSPTGTPVGREMTLEVFRQVEMTINPVLAALPWIPRPIEQTSRVLVESISLVTSDEDGTVRHALRLDDGGSHVIQVRGTDRLGLPVTAEALVFVSGSDDPVRLRWMSAAQDVPVGEEVTLPLYARTGPGLVLLTWDGDGVIDHRVIEITSGDNDVSFMVDHAHFPNVTLTATMMEGRDVHVATKPFTVHRALTVAIDPASDSFAPGEEGVVDLRVTDQTGAPVEAELSLAMVDGGLYDLFPDTTEKIRDFFEAGAHRQAEYRVNATNDFAYRAETRVLDPALLDEDARLALGVERQAQLGQVLVESDSAMDSIESLGLSRRSMASRGRPTSAPGGPMTEASEASSEMMFFFGKPTVAGGGFAAAQGSGIVPKARDLAAQAGAWLPSIRTDVEGRASVTITMPDRTTGWRLTAVGVTRQTLAGQSTSTVKTRKDFFIELRSPALVVEGDKITLLARIRNGAGYSGDVLIRTSVIRPGSTEDQAEVFEQTHVIASDQELSVMLPAITAAQSGTISISVAAFAGEHVDHVRTHVEVRPWGVEWIVQDGGVTSGVHTTRLTFPAGREYQSASMKIRIGPDLQSSVLDMVFGAHDPIFRAIVPRTPDQVLLASVSALAYGREAGAGPVERSRLEEMVRASIGTIVATQHQDGSWGWFSTQRPDWRISAASYRALATAARVGFTIDRMVMQKARMFLEQSYQSTPVDQRTRRSILLEALAVGGDVDFKLVNTLYRDRNVLEPMALARTVLALAHLDRMVIAREVAAILESKVQLHGDGSARRASWIGADHRLLGLLPGQDVDTTAVALLALLAVLPDSPLVDQAVAELLARRGTGVMTRGRNYGTVVEALADWFGRARFLESDGIITVTVNGTVVGTVEARGGQPSEMISVPPDLLVDEGPQLIKVAMDGRGTYAWSATLQAFSHDLVDPRGWDDRPYVHGRQYFHAPLRYRNRSIGVASTSPVRSIETGQRIRVAVSIPHKNEPRFPIILHEPLPAGLQVVPGSLASNASHHEIRPGLLVLYYPGGSGPRNFSYELVGHAPGTYRVGPTIMRDADDPSRMRIGSPAELTVLPPGEESSDAYAMNDAERFALGLLNFDDGLYHEALAYLWPLFDRSRKYQERETARMLLWIYTSSDYYDASRGCWKADVVTRVVDAFELLNVRFPTLTIPFDRILIVGRAYRDLGEHERAFSVYRATIDSSFLNDSAVSALLQDEGQLLASVAFQEDLWWAYPDTPDVSESHFSLSQILYDHASQAASLKEQPVRFALVDDEDVARIKPNGIDMLVQAIGLLQDFRTMYPGHALSDDAAFSLCNALLDLEKYAQVVDASGTFWRQFPESEFTSSFRFMEALGHFWQRHYQRAMASARVVADGVSDDRDYARYILGQIFHAQGDPARAITWYELVRSIYPDAEESIAYFKRKAISMEEVTIFRPGARVELMIDHRNIAEAEMLVYRVDLMTLYLMEKNLSRITEVDLAGIKPELVKTIRLSSTKSFLDLQSEVRLAVSEEGAYLVICRGDDLFTSSLVLLTTLDLEVQEDATSGRVRVNVIDRVADERPVGVHVKVIGSGDGIFRSGDTDLRGLYVADGVRGLVTAIARGSGSRYAFYRGEQWVGPQAGTPVEAGRMLEEPEQVDYGKNLRTRNRRMQQEQYGSWNEKRRSSKKGVEVQQAN